METISEEEEIEGKNRKIALTCRKVFERIAPSSFRMSSFLLHYYLFSFFFVCNTLSTTTCFHFIFFVCCSWLKHTKKLHDTKIFISYKVDDLILLFHLRGNGSNQQKKYINGLRYCERRIHSEIY